MAPKSNHPDPGYDALHAKAMAVNAERVRRNEEARAAVKAREEAAEAAKAEAKAKAKAKK